MPVMQSVLARGGKRLKTRAAATRRPGPPKLQPASAPPRSAAPARARNCRRPSGRLMRPDARSCALVRRAVAARERDRGVRPLLHEKQVRILGAVRVVAVAEIV